MTEITNEKLRALVEAATPGVWKVDYDPHASPNLWVVQDDPSDLGFSICKFEPWADDGSEEDGDEEKLHPIDWANAALIAAAPSLAAEVLALRAPRKASESQDDDSLEWSEAYLTWLRDLEERVIQEVHGYEPGEFSVYPESWAQMYEDGLTPDAAWRRAMEAHAQARRDEDAAQKARYELIKRDDQIAILSAERDRLSEEAAALRGALALADKALRPVVVHASGGPRVADMSAWLANADDAIGQIEALSGEPQP